MIIDTLDYKKYHISIYEDVDYKNSFYCQVFLITDTEREECIDDFCVLEEQLEKETLKKCIENYIDTFLESEVH